MTLNCFVLGVTLKRLARSVLGSASDPQGRRFQEEMAASEFSLVNRRCGVEGWACGASVLFPLSRECMRPKLYMSTVESPSFAFFLWPASV